MTLERLIEKFNQWLQEKVVAKITIELNDGGIRDVKIEKRIK